MLQTSMQPEDMFTSLGGTEVCTTEKRGRNIKVMAGEEATAPRTWFLLAPLALISKLTQMLGKPISLSVLEQLCFSESDDSQTALEREACLYTTNILKQRPSGILCASTTGKRRA